MTLNVEIPSPLAEHFDAEAREEGGSPSNRARWLLIIADAIQDTVAHHESGKEISGFQEAVRSFCSSRHIDPVQIGAVVNELVLLCLNDDMEADETLLAQLNQRTGRLNRASRPTSQDSSLVIDKEIEDAAWTIYDSKLKQNLEPERNGEVVAIHTDTGEFEVARSSSRARRALRSRQASGPIVVIDIGPVSLDNPLALRSSGLLQRPTR